MEEPTQHRAKAGLDPFIRDSIFPEPSQIFTFRLKPLAEVKSSAIVVLDTNVLLVPYTASKGSLAEIRTVYGTLAAEGRIFVPAQVAREFAEHRATDGGFHCVGVRIKGE